MNSWFAHPPCARKEVLSSGPKTRRLISRAGFALAICLGTLANAHADEPHARNVRAHVVALDGSEIIIDIGANTGAAVGDQVQLWRPFKLKHPVTGRPVEDRFQVGLLRIIKLGSTLSMARLDGTPERAPQPGDVVIFEPPAAAILLPSSAPTTAGTVAPSKQSPPTEQPASIPSALDQETKELTALFDSLQGADPVTRIRAYEQFVKSYPAGRFSRVLYEEAQALRVLTSRVHQPQQDPTEIKALMDSVLAECMAGTPLDIGIELAGNPAGAVLHYRSDDESTYSSSPMRNAGNGYFVVTIEATKIRAPRLHYFINATKSTGEPVLILGSASDPRAVTVLPIPSSAAPKRLDASASFLTDYASYNSLKGNDYAWQSEGQFKLRMDNVGLRSFGSGFGVFRGAGGSIKDLDELKREPRAIGLTYGYLEAEVGVSDFVGIIGRAVVGLKDSGTTGGGQLFLRIGNDRKTNLMIGGELLDGVGTRGITQLELNTFPRVPITLRTEVTNQPAGVTDNTPTPLNSEKAVKDTSTEQSEIGARAIVQVGYRFTPAFVFSLRTSYQGRTINHAGPGFGAGLSYAW